MKQQEETKLNLNWILCDHLQVPKKFSHSSNLHEQMQSLMIRASESGHMKIIEWGKDSGFIYTPEISNDQGLSECIKKNPRTWMQYFQDVLSDFDPLSNKAQKAGMILWRVHQNPRDLSSLELLLHWSKNTFSHTFLSLNWSKADTASRSWRKAAAVRLSPGTLDFTEELPVAREVSLTYADRIEIGSVQTCTSFEIAGVRCSTYMWKPLNLASGSDFCKAMSLTQQEQHA